MTLRNVPITYTLDQQRQEINNLAGDVNDIDVNFNEKVDDRINALITAGTGISAVYDDTANTYALALDFANPMLVNLLKTMSNLSADTPLSSLANMLTNISKLASGKGKLIVLFSKNFTSLSLRIS